MKCALKISPISWLVIISVLASSTFARPVVEWLRENIGNSGITLLVGALASICILLLLYKVAALSRLRILLTLIFICCVALYLTTFQIAEERIHILKYGLIAFLAARDNAFQRPGTTFLIAVVTATLVGTCDELLQSIIPGRVGDPRDVLFDFIGALIGTFSHTLINKRFQVLT